MGIDPLTHKPLPADQLPKEKQEDQQVGPSSESESSSMESSITDQANEELNPDEGPLKEVINNEELNPDEGPLMEVINNGFCTDEVPLIEPHEISLVSASCSSSSTPSSSSSSIIQEFDFPNFDWQCDIINSLDFWDGDFNFSSTLDLLINYDSDRNNVTPIPGIVWDQEPIRDYII
ncbi:hypothetical protein RHGRI_030162 [Rhododendron griersonianum]|uniref:Uncharacterized protein n=1 Tax=Rhododendron griersonianum TaxID=479676 RepID=A0AAV6IM04_9ERIC|nr:hypothetical protein RHGRI_030162 [Rhododendron griersonianum]